MKTTLLRLHRWAALIFAIPLALVLFSGLVLSFDPWLVDSAARRGSVSGDQVVGILNTHDPDGTARGLFYRAYDGTLTILGASGSQGATTVDAASGEPATPSALAALMGTMRGLHERLLIDATWLVVASTIAMLVIIVLGLLMGLPRIRNTVAGWHKAVAWILLPLVVLSPVTGLMIALGVTFTGPQQAGQQQRLPVTIADAVRAVDRDHDLSSLVWIRSFGPRVMARVVEDGEYRVYAVSPDGLAPTQRNWPRLWHEGNFAGVWSALLNIVTSLALIGLLGSGIWLWARRKLRKRNRRGIPALP